MVTTKLGEVLVRKGYFDSYKLAYSNVLQGNVYVDGQKITRIGFPVKETSTISVRKKKSYISRGEFKLVGALDHFKISVDRSVCIDIGASTGGFTRILLERGAKRVYAVDVGYGLLDSKLRTDERVVVLERRNIRFLREEEIPDKAALIVVDVSFISVGTFLDNLVEFLDLPADLLLLFKPQHEIEKSFIYGHPDLFLRGVVLEETVIFETLLQFICFLNASDLSRKLRLKAIRCSDILGRRGNLEIFIHLARNRKKEYKTPISITSWRVKASREIARGWAELKG